MNQLPPARPFRSVPLRRRLLAIAVSGILPLALVSGLGLVTIIEEQKTQVERRALEVTRLFATAIEVELRRSTDVLMALSQSPLLDSGELGGFEELVARVLPTTPGWRAVNLATPDGRVISRVALSGPRRRSAALSELRSFSEVIRTGRPQVGHLGQGPEGAWAIPLRVPVVRNGELKYVLNAIVRPEAIRDVITARGLPQHWVTTVIDGNGRRIARTQHHEQSFAAAASPTLAHMLATSADDEGIGLTTTLEGQEVYTAFVRLGSGWAVATGIPTQAIHGAAIRAFTVYGGGLLLSLLIAALAAVFAARRINEPMRALRAAAQAIGASTPPAIPHSDIAEIDEVGCALTEAANARRQSEGERDRVVARLEQTREALTQQVIDLELLQRLNERLLELPSLEAQLAAILDAFCAFHSASHGLVVLTTAGSAPEIAAAKGFSEESLALLRALPPEAGPWVAAIQQRRRVVVIRDESDPLFRPLQPIAQREGFSAVHTSPLLSSAGGVIGTIAVQMAEARQPTVRETRLADLCAGLAVVTIERARARAAAGASEQRLHVALDSSTVPFAVLTRVVRDDITDFRCDFVNRTAALTLRRPRTKLIGITLGDILADQFPAAIPLLTYVVEQRSPCERELQSETKPELWYQLVATPFQAVATPFQESIAVWFSDISERKRQERALQDADRRKDEFLATLAHELRNPLAPIRQAAAIVGSATATDAQKQWSSAVIERQVRHMALLLDDLLDISRITLAKLELRKQHIDLRDVVAAALQSTQPLLDIHRHELRIALPQQPLMMNVDPLRLEQILVNLLTNAAKYTEEGGCLELAVRELGTTVEVSVSDNGIGIAPEDLDRVFHMFTQLRTTSSRPGNGLGIGLALARGLAILHGGDLRVASSGKGQGSCFTLALPMDAPEPLQPVIAAQPTAVAASRRVLIADDNRDIAETLAELLQLEGHQVCLAFTGLEALERYRSFKPDIALLDIGMPGMRGEEVAKAIRSLPDGSDVVLVAITGWGQDKDKATSAQAGFDRHLTKPVDIAAILDIVAAAASRPTAEPLSGATPLR